MSPPSYTPLRYPGGKARLGPYLAAVLRANRLMDGTYVEPYAGGAGAALFLLFRGYVSRLILNDIDPAVAAFWRAVLNHNERFAEAIETIPLTVPEWDRQRQVYRSAKSGFELGFSFFYLNRTNRSGIMNAGMIGGRAQTSRWAIDARFNRAQLAERVRALRSLRRHIAVRRSDALTFLESVTELRPKRPLVYLDPPYFGKGRDLYTNFYGPDDHQAISEYLRAYPLPWIVTYDDCGAIRQLYAGFPTVNAELSYSAREFRHGRELIIFSRGLQAPTVTGQGRRHRPSFRVLQGA